MKSIEQALMEQQIKSTDIATRLLAIGKNETSAIIKYSINLHGDEIIFNTTITLLPIRRIYKTGGKIVDDEYLTYEIEDTSME